jgi:hypothetical protein
VWRLRVNPASPARPTKPSQPKSKLSSSASVVRDISVEAAIEDGESDIPERVPDMLELLPERFEPLPGCVELLPDIREESLDMLWSVVVCATVSPTIIKPVAKVRFIGVSLPPAITGANTVPHRLTERT